MPWDPDWGTPKRTRQLHLWMWQERAWVGNWRERERALRARDARNQAFHPRPILPPDDDVTPGPS